MNVTIATTKLATFSSVAHTIKFTIVAIPEKEAPKSVISSIIYSFKSFIELIVAHNERLVGIALRVARECMVALASYIFTACD